MDEVMQDYYETWKFRHPGTEEFKASFTQLVDKDLSWFFDDAIDGTKVIDYAVSSINNHHVLIKNHGTMSPPLELAFYDKNNEEIDRVWLEGFGIEKKADLPSGTEIGVNFNSMINWDWGISKPGFTYSRETNSNTTVKEIKRDNYSLSLQHNFSMNSSPGSINTPEPLLDLVNSPACVAPSESTPFLVNKNSKTAYIFLNKLLLISLKVILFFILYILTNLCF